jgi:hypothetical protein
LRTLQGDPRILDDSLRRILSGGQFDAETTENRIQLLEEAMEKYGSLASIEPVLTYRGAQFYAKDQDKNSNADSRLKNVLDK